MNHNIFIIPTIITLLFCIAKFIEMKFIDNELKPLKYVIRDATIVFVCSLLATFLNMNMNGTIHEFINVVTDTKTIPIGGNTDIFTGDPEF